jgi:acyl-[acyl carrier protein]--UDP-N-acetylglucosamine O-acyltransferase
MSSIDRNFIVKQGLEVAEDLIFADGNLNKVGINTRNPSYDFQVSGNFALENSFLVKSEGLFSETKVGILSQFAPSFITGINTTDLRLNDIIVDLNNQFISPNTTIVGIQSGIVQLSNPHSNNSNGDLVTFTVSRNFDSGAEGNVLISQGPNQPPIWTQSVDDVSFTNADKFYYPTFVEQFGRTELFANNDQLVFNPAQSRLGIGTTTPQANLDVNGDVSIASSITVGGFTKLDDELSVFGNASLKSSLTVDNNVSTGSSLTVGGLGLFKSDVKIDNSAEISVDLDIGGKLTVGENAEFLSEISVLGQASIGSTLTVSSNAEIIGGLNVGNSTLIEGTLDVNDVTTINNNLNVTENVTATSYFGVGDNLVGIVTQIVPSIGINISSTQEPGKGIVTIDAYNPAGKTIFVKQNGNDNNSGLAENDAKRTIKSAASIALFGDTIKVFPGTYVEENPIVLNPTVSVEGAELRNCVITPKNPSKDLFQVNNGCHITDVSFIGQESQDDAAIIAFQPLLGVESDRYFDAARIIRMNLDFIAAEAVGYLTSTDYQNPPFELQGSDYSSCKDDVKDVFRAVIHDITRGGNSRCVGAGLSYYSGNTLQHIVGVKTETIDTLQFAVGVARSCINNVLWQGNYQTQESQVRDLSIQPDPLTGSNVDINSCANVLSAVQSCVGIVTTIIDQGPSAGIVTTFPGNSGIGFTTLNSVSNASYDEISGKVTLTVPNYPAKVGDIVEIRDLEFECTSNGSPIIQKFPSGKFGYEFYIERINPDTSFDVYVGVSTIPHTYVSGTGFLVNRSIEVTDAVYDNVTGITTITAPGAYVKEGDFVTLRDLEFSCPSGPAILKYPSGQEGFAFKVDEVIGMGTTFVVTVGTSTLPHTYEGGGLVFPAYSRGVGPITQGPYVRNCTNFVPKSIGMKVDGFAAEPGDKDDIGVTGTMSVDSYTQYNQAGVGVSITNGAYSQLVSIFTICTDTAIFTGSGGQCDITNSNSSFGTLGLVSNGVGDNNTKSIYRYTGEVVTEAQQEQAVIAVGGIGTYRPYDGQAIYFGELYYTVQSFTVTDGGSGYIQTPNVVIDAPTGPNGIRAEAIATIENGSVVSVDIISTGNQYQFSPNVTFVGGGGNGAAATANISPIYYTIESATLPSSGISTITLNTNLNNTVSIGTTVYFSRLSLQITSSHSFEWVGSGNDIFKAKPALGGVVITENEVVKIDGGEVIYTSTDQAGNFRIGDDIVINQLTGTISGRAFSQNILSTVTPLIVAVG